VLSLSNYRSITEVPNSIEIFLYLRYLNLSHTKTEKLPSETCKLYNLQFLLLACCRRLIELPEDMEKLVNLRHPDVSDTASKYNIITITLFFSSRIMFRFTPASAQSCCCEKPNSHVRPATKSSKCCSDGQLSTAAIYPILLHRHCKTIFFIDIKNTSNFESYA